MLNLFQHLIKSIAYKTLKQVQVTERRLLQEAQYKVILRIYRKTFDNTNGGGGKFMKFNQLLQEQ
jgi:hypothetical protein